MSSEFDLIEKNGFWYASGALNENARFGPLLGSPPPVRVNVSRISSTNSLGIKIFVRFMEAMRGVEVEFHECSYVMLELFNSFPAALGQPPVVSRVHSFHLPFACSAGHQYPLLFTTKEILKGREDAVAPRTCLKCKQKAALEGRLDDYLMFFSHDQD